MATLPLSFFKKILHENLHIKKKSFQKGDWALLYDSRFQDLLFLLKRTIVVPLLFFSRFFSYCGSFVVPLKRNDCFSFVVPFMIFFLLWLLFVPFKKNDCCSDFFSFVFPFTIFFLLWLLCCSF
jgi:hypothetical protein